MQSADRRGTRCLCNVGAQRPRLVLRPVRRCVPDFSLIWTLAISGWQFAESSAGVSVVCHRVAVCHAIVTRRVARNTMRYQSRFHLVFAQRWKKAGRVAGIDGPSMRTVSQASSYENLSVVIP